MTGGIGTPAEDPRSIDFGEAGQPPSDHAAWAVIVTMADGIHVVPTFDGRTAAAGHAARILCSACQPIPVRDGPLEDPTWSHVEPGWPGAVVSRPMA